MQKGMGWCTNTPFRAPKAYHERSKKRGLWASEIPLTPPPPEIPPYTIETLV